MRLASESAGLCALILACGTSLPAADAPSLVNGDFAEWRDDVPQGWRVEIGAQNGAGPDSKIGSIDKSGGLSLTGDAATTRWKSTSQSFAVESNAYYRLTFKARARDAQRMGRQFDNCFVGIFGKDADGKVVDRQISTISNSDFAVDTLVLTFSPKVKTGDVVIFLSKTGVLEVRSVALDRLRAEDSFRLLVDEIDRKYSFLGPKHIHWRDVAGRYAARAEKAEDAAAFVIVIREMLGELRDPHVTIQTPDNHLLATCVRDFRSNYNFKYVVSRLEKVEQIGKIAFVGRGAGGIGYVAVGVLAGDEATRRKLDQAVAGLLDAPGLIVDLRGNDGGDERLARHIVGLFTDKPIVYAKSKYRSGSGHTDLSPPLDRIVEPRDTKGAYLRPIACLLGPKCISSGEDMALMLNALPHVTTMGQPTAGASGNPAPLPLPNGVTVSYSRWLSLTPDGELIEDKGVHPKIVVEPTASGDATFDAALDLIAKKMGGN